jgi:hypothetical protein
MIGHDASMLASEYGPQWMNMPNFAWRYQAVRSSSRPAKLNLGIKGTAEAAKARFINSRLSKL